MHDLASAIGWADIITQLLIYLATAVAIPLAIKYIAKWTNLKIDDKTRGYVEAAAAAAIRHGVTAYAAKNNMSIPAVIEDAATKTDVRGVIIDHASDYLATSVPDGLKRLGVSTTDQIETIARTRLDKGLNSLSSDIEGAVASVTAINATKSTGRPVTTPRTA